MARIWIVGAAATCDIKPESSYVSGKHCRLEYDGATWTVEDLGSRNGTFVNGHRIEGKAVVTPSDMITLGRTVPFHLPDPQAPQPARVRSAGSRPAARLAVGRSLTLPPPGHSITVGRGQACEVVLDAPMVSLRHLRIEHVDDGWVVRDLGSTNGTFVRGSRIDGPVAVSAGEVVRLGSFELTLSEDGRYLVKQDRRAGLAVEVSHVAVEAAGRRLLADVSLVVKQGELVGIMGASGAGKSTLLATLVGDQHPAEGHVVVGGIDLHARFDELRGQVGYVPQDDIMHPDLTVWQSLWYSARLRLPRDYGDDEIRNRLNRVISQLGLEGEVNTRIGTTDRRGISGGQRKRVNVAMELITDPPVLILDEPTSGLSSVDALRLVQLLRSLANCGKAVIITIHQPSNEILGNLDAVAVLAKDESTDNAGTLVWYGPALPDAAHFFEPGAAVLQAPLDAGAILRGLSARSAAEWLKAYRATVAHATWVAGRPADPAGSPQEQERRQASAFDALFQGWVLTRRMLAIKLADRWNTAVLLAQAPLIALLIAGVFGDRVNRDPNPLAWQGVATAVALTTFLLALAAVWFGVSNAAREIVAERVIYRRERMVGLARTAYLGSKIVVLLLLSVIQCSVLFYGVAMGCGLGGNHAYALFVLILTACAGAAIGLTLSASVRSSEAAAAALPLILLPMVVLGGSLLPLEELPAAAARCADLMPSRWGFEGLVCNEAAVRPVFQWAGEAASHDMAAPWFPRNGWRSRSFVPPVMLLGLTVLGIYAAATILAASDARRRERLTA
jgi:ABC-type multidrug transport system ATPase subunit/pSer/pThr/pTyr-binding forkhead associated (FHA) protein